MKHALRICNEPGCPAIAVESGRCAVHQRPVAPRPAAYFQPYMGEWRKIREKFLREHPYCALCNGQATVVDHVLPLARGGTHDTGNLEALCRSCHSRKTATYDGAFGNAKR